MNAFSQSFIELFNNFQSLYQEALNNKSSRDMKRYLGEVDATLFRISWKYDTGVTDESGVLHDLLDVLDSLLEQKNSTDMILKVTTQTINSVYDLFREYYFELSEIYFEEI